MKQLLASQFGSLTLKSLTYAEKLKMAPRYDELLPGRTEFLAGCLSELKTFNKTNQQLTTNMHATYMKIAKSMVGADMIGMVNVAAVLALELALLLVHNLDVALQCDWKGEGYHAH